MPTAAAIPAIAGAAGTVAAGQGLWNSAENTLTGGKGWDGGGNQPGQSGNAWSGYSQQPVIPGAAQPVWNKFINSAENSVQGMGNFANQYQYNPTYAQPFNTNMGMTTAGQYTSPQSGMYTGNMTPGQQASSLGTANWSGSNDPTMQAGAQMLQDTLGGKYLTPSSNPYLAQAGQAATDQAMVGLGGAENELQSQFRKMGVSYSGPIAQQLAGSNLQNLNQNLTNMYGNAYQNERGNQMGAANTGLNYANTGYQNYMQGLGFNAQQNQLGNQINSGNYLTQQNYAPGMYGQALQQMPLYTPQQSQGLGSQLAGAAGNVLSQNAGNILGGAQNYYNQNIWPMFNSPSANSGIAQLTNYQG